MSSMTAQLSVGMPDQYHDGIRPTHALWLRENDQAAWTLIDVYSDIYGDPDPASDSSEPWATEPVRWIGNQPEQILQNGFLILALHVFRDEVLIEETKQRLPALLEPGYVDLWKLDPAALDDLHQLTMDTELPGKVVVTVLGGSSLEPQLPLLERFSTQLEVCTVTYSHTWGGFMGQSEAEPAGSLTASWSSDGPTPHRYRDVNFPSSLPGDLAERSAASAEGLGERFALRRWVEAREELLQLEIIRTANSNVVGGYAELLVGRNIGGVRPEGADTGADLVLEGGTRVQVKARRDPAHRLATHWDIRELDVEGRFHELVAVIFTHDFDVRVAWQMPWETVARLATPPASPGGMRRLFVRAVEEALSDGDQTISEIPLDQRAALD
jgi:hypothetical protein